MPSLNSSTSQSSDPAKVDGVFYLWSKIGSVDWVLTARDATPKETPGIYTHLDHARFLPEQLWTRVWAPDGGSFHLMNQKYNKALRQNGLQGGKLMLVDHSESDNNQKWRGETWGGWCGINTLVDWEQKINVRGNGPYTSDTDIIMWEYCQGAPNESWKAVTDFGQFEVADIKYDVSRLVSDLNLPPKDCVPHVIDNSLGSEPINSALTLKYETTSSTSFSYGTSTTQVHTISQTIGVKLKIGEVLKFGSETQYTYSKSETVSYGEDHAESTTAAKELTISVSVPPRKKYQYWVVVKSGKISVPYTATINRISGGRKNPITVTGQYERIDATSFEIVAKDMGADHHTVIRSASLTDAQTAAAA